MLTFWRKSMNWFRSHSYCNSSDIIFQHMIGKIGFISVHFTAIYFAKNNVVFSEWTFLSANTCPVMIYDKHHHSIWTHWSDGREGWKGHVMWLLPYPRASIGSRKHNHCHSYHGLCRVDEGNLQQHRLHDENTVKIERRKTDKQHNTSSSLSFIRHLIGMWWEENSVVTVKNHSLFAIMIIRVLFVYTWLNERHLVPRQ